MKLIDKLKLVWHNIKLNKSRSIITLIIVYIISLIVMGIVVMGISFVGNMNRVQKEKLEAQEIKISHSNPENLSLDCINSLNNVFEKYQEYITNITTAVSGGFGFGSKRLEVYDFNYFNEINCLIVEGEKPNSTLSNTNNVYLHSSYNQEYQIGDEYVLSYNGGSHTFVVGGFYEQRFYYGKKPNAIQMQIDEIIDMTYFVNNISLIDNFQIHYNYQGEVDVIYCIKKLNKFKNEVKKALPTEFNMVSASTLDRFYKAYLMNYIIVAFACVLGFILILMSVGSISNTLIISIDKNKKFFGLLKAIGIKNKDVLWLVLYEGFLMIILGSVFAFLTLLCNINTMKSIVADIVRIVLNYSFADATVNATFTMPYYIVLINILAFIIFTFLLSRTSLNDVYKNAPIKVINEVK